MKDLCFITEPVARVEITDHVELGRLVTQWALDPRSRPRSLAELRRELDGIAVLPDSIESFSFQNELPEHLTIQLPDPEAILQRSDDLEDPVRPPRYDIPRFYSDHFSLGTAPVLTPLDIFYARIGERSFSHLP